MDTNTPKAYTVSRGKFLGIFLGAVVVSSVTSIFATIRILNSDHFTLLTLSGRVDAIERLYIPRNELELRLQTLMEGNKDQNDRLNRIETKLDNVILIQSGIKR